MKAILRAILDGYALRPEGDHGVVHWARVAENGRRLAEATGADGEVVTLFALFHDSRRVNEHRDPGHGRRGADLARSLRGTRIHLDDARFELLHEACAGHTAGKTSDDATLAACWDADRLDLGRVGIEPVPHRLCSEAARELLAWAHDRAVRGYRPVSVLEAWGYPGGRRDGDRR